MIISSNKIRSGTAYVEEMCSSGEEECVNAEGQCRREIHGELAVSQHRSQRNVDGNAGHRCTPYIRQKTHSEHLELDGEHRMAYFSTCV